MKSNAVGCAGIPSSLFFFFCSSTISSRVCIYLFFGARPFHYLGAFVPCFILFYFILFFFFFIFFFIFFFFFKTRYHHSRPFIFFTAFPYRKGRAGGMYGNIELENLLLLSQQQQHTIVFSHIHSIDALRVDMSKNPRVQSHTQKKGGGGLCKKKKRKKLRGSKTRTWFDVRSEIGRCIITYIHEAPIFRNQQSKFKKKRLVDAHCTCACTNPHTHTHTQTPARNTAT